VRYATFSRGFATALFLTAAALGQLPQGMAAGVAHIQAPAAVQARARATATAEFTITIDAGYHIQSNHPKLDYLIPTTLAIEPAGGVHATGVAWPKAQNHTFSFSPGQPLAVFEGTMHVPVTLATGAAGTRVLHGSFRYQACNDQLCRPPVTQRFTLKLVVR
jgi:hypothetical protein